MSKYRSSKTTNGKNMSGARALWRATGMKDSDFKKPIIGVVNSYTEFVPGHIHLRSIGKMICKEIYKSGGISKEFNTIAIDDGIAMGHSGMLYSLPSREIIADSVEYVINAHCVDAIICLSNCDKITPGMLMAALRLNIPAIFVSGGPMEAGKIKIIKNKKKIYKKIDLVDAIISGTNPKISESESIDIEKSACPTCGSCSGMFTANSMNCLLEALGLALPGNGTLLATHSQRKKLFLKSSKIIVKNTKKFYKKKNKDVLPRNIANRKSFINAMSVDIAMGGSTNTVLHLLAAAQEGKINFKMHDIDYLSRKIPHLCKVSPSTNKYHIEDVHRAGGVFGIISELNKLNLIATDLKNVLGKTLKETIKEYDILTSKKKNIIKMYKSGPKGFKTKIPFSQSFYWDTLDTNRKIGCIRSYKYAYSKEGGLAILKGNIAKKGCIVKTAGVDKSLYYFSGLAKVYESQEDAVESILLGKIKPGDIVVIRYEGPKGGPGMQEMLYPTSYLKSMNLDKKCALITDGRFSGGTSGLSIGHISPEAANKGEIALIKNNDTIIIDILKRSIFLKISKKELLIRKKKENLRGNQRYTPKFRKRKISNSLKCYSYFANSADKGASRNVKKINI